MRRSNTPKPEAPVPKAVRSAASATIAVMLMSACGGSSNATEDAESVATTTSVSGGASEADSDNQDGSGNYAIVTIGTIAYEVPADPLNLCNSLDNLIFGSYATDAGGEATQAGGTDVSIQVNFGLPVTDWEEQGLQPPIVNVDLIDDGVRWFASTERGLGMVDSWQLADGKATGEASFVGEAVGSGEEVGAESGSFEVICR